MTREEFNKAWSPNAEDYELLADWWRDVDALIAAVRRMGAEEQKAKCSFHNQCSAANKPAPVVNTPSRADGEKE